MTILEQAVLEMGKSVMAHLLKESNHKKVMRFYLAAKIYSHAILQPAEKPLGTHESAKRSIECANSFMDEWEKANRKEE